jgi:lipopolysaccharide export system protein LptA
MYRRHLSCLTLLLLFSIPAAALKSDRSQPIDVDAGSADFDEASGITVLSGGVLLEQGSLQISTQTATIHRDPEAGSINRIILEGNPATIEQLLDEQPAQMKARAQRIEYDLLTQTITLINAAELDQGSRHFSGARFEYDIANSRVKAQSTPGGDGRVRMTFDPATDPTAVPPQVQEPVPSPDDSAADETADEAANETGEDG